MRDPSFCAASSVVYSVHGRRPQADETDDGPRPLPEDAR
ncbi:hypothetical protein STAFG_0106 [Streptomyces afghaniensis 772]|uniref:Uncharacterized protein n=2 Tax=Streptomyces afghaniensis 772 TaxID=1283301 RepID=S4MTI3_9ACTN|nr:hypothetical protein STAFG_0106 [Streptomyces afghaniensis 772]